MSKRRGWFWGGMGLCWASLAMAEPLVYAGLDQAQLDRAYDQSQWAPDFKQTIAAYRSTSDEVKGSLPPRTLTYGDGPLERMDVYAPPGQQLPVMVFIHGGAWKSLSKDDSAGPAPAFVKSGVMYIALDFPVIPQTDLAGMIEQCRKALLYIHDQATQLGADSSRIYVSGHSSGGHLAAVMLTTDWSAYGAPKDLLKGGVVLSGMGDLTGPMRSSRGQYLKLDDAQIAAFSPLQHLDVLQAPVIVGWGSRESPEFIRQNQALAQGFRDHGKLFAEQAFEGVDHFTMANLLNDPNGWLVRQTLSMMGIKRQVP